MVLCRYEPSACGGFVGPRRVDMRTRWALQVPAAAVAWTLAIGLCAPSYGQTSPADATTKPAEPAPPISNWTFSFTPYGWFTAMSGGTTVKGHSVSIDTNVIQMFDKSQSLIPFMAYTEARYQDR